MKNLRCIVVGSSMTMPSFDLNYEQTWLYKLIKHYPNIEFIDKNTRSSSVRRLVTEGALSKGYDLLEYYAPDFIITQIGIADCSPRLLKREAFSTKLINAMPFSNWIYNIVRKTKGRTISCCDIDTTTFYKCLETYAERASQSQTQIFCIKIAHTGTGVVKKSPHMLEAIDLYNKEFDKLAASFNNVTLITPFPEDANLQELLIKDEIHPNEKGSEIIFQNIVNAIEPYLRIIADNK